MKTLKLVVRRVYQFFVGPYGGLRRVPLAAGEIQWVPLPMLLRWYGPPEADLHFNQLGVVGVTWLRHNYGLFWIDNN